MSVIYSTASGAAQKFNNETWAFRQSQSEDVNLEGFVKNGVLLKKSVLSRAGIAGEAIPRHAEVTKDSNNKIVVATNATKTPLGSASKDYAAGEVVYCAYFPKSINKAGNTAISAADDLVIGAGGRVATYQGSAVSLASSVAGAASADFTNSVFSTAQRAIVDTAADDATARGLFVTLHFINEAGEYDTEIVTIDEVDSSENVLTTKKIAKLLAFSVSGTISTSTLQIKNEAGSTCKTVATPTGGTVYGSITPDDSTDPVGQSVQISATTAPVDGAKIVVYGTDDDSAVLTEILTGNGVLTSFKTTKQFKAISRLLIGDDGVATNTYTIQVLANSSGQKIGTAAAAAAANAEVLVTRNNL